MRTTRTAQLATLLLLGTLASSAAQAQQAPPPPQDQGTQAPAPVERQAPPQGPRSMSGMHRPMMQGHDWRSKHGGAGFDEKGAAFRIVPPGMWWKNPALVQRLALTPEQTKKMDDIFQQSRLQLVDLKANLEKQNLVLEPMLSANPIDQAKAMAQIDKVAQARAELEKADAKMLLGIRGVLTPDQWTKLQSGERPGPGGSAPMRGRGPGGGGMGGRMGGPGGMEFVAPELPSEM